MSGFGWSSARVRRVVGALTCTPLAFLAVGVMASPTTAQTAVGAPAGADPAALAARATGSEPAPGELSVSEARRVADRHFATQLDAPVVDGSRPAPSLERDPAGRPDDGFLGAYRELVRDRRTGERGVVVSATPLSVPVGDGERRAVDLSLQRDGDVVRPRRAVVPIEVSPTDGSVAFPGGGFAVGLADMGSEASSSVSDDAVFTANARTDSDYVVRPTPSGAESFIQIRSDDAPQQYRFHVSLPDGATLQHTHVDDPPGGQQPDTLAVMKDGHALGHIAAAQTIDANNRVVPTTTSIDGNDVVVTVEHHDANLRFPLLVDPQVWTEAQYCNNTFPGWVANQSTAAYPSGAFDLFNCNTSYAPGLYVGMRTNTKYGSGPSGTFDGGEYGEFRYTAPPSTYIQGISYANISNYDPWFDLFETGIQKTTGPANWYSNVGAVNPGTTPKTGYPNPARSSAAFTAGHLDTCFVQNPPIDPNNPACIMPAGDEQDVGVFRIQPTYQGSLNGQPGMNTATHTPHITMGQSTVNLGDTHNPKFSSTAPASKDWYNDNNAIHNVSATLGDVGLGVYAMALYGATGGNETQYANCNYAPAPGAAPCPASFTNTYSYTLPEGDNTLSVTGNDLVGNLPVDQNGDPQKGALVWHEKIDRSSPTFDSVTGSLATASSAHTKLTGSSYQVNFTASDGTPNGTAAQQRSGVAKVEVRLDSPTGTLLSTGPNQTCTGDSCPLSGAFTLYTRSIPRGAHTLYLVATDKASNTPTISSLAFFNDPTAGDQPGFQYVDNNLNDRMSAAVNVGTGELDVDAQDIDINSVGMDLDIERSYHSNVDDDGHIGTGWSLNVGPDIHLSTITGQAGLPDGSVLLNDQDRSGYVFEKQSDGTYADPAGSGAHLARRSDGTYTLTDYSDNSTELFATDGALTAMRDRDGNGLNVAYTDPAHTKLATVTDTEGHTVTAQYTGNNLTGFNDGTGRTWGYGYDSQNQGELAQYTDPAGSVTKYGYSPTNLPGPKALNQITDPAGRVTSFGYDPAGSGRVTSIDWADHSTVQIAYDVKQTDPLLPDACKTQDASVASTTVVIDGSSDGSKDPLNLHDPLDASGPFKTCYLLDSAGRPLYVVDPKGNKETIGYDTQHHTRSHGKGATKVTNDFGPDTGVNPLAARDQLRDSTTMAGTDEKATYDDTARPVGNPNPLTTTDAQGNTWTYGYNAHYDLTSITTADGKVPVKLGRNADGTFSSSLTKDHGGSDGKTDQLTTYGYTNHEQTSINPPGPMGATAIHYDSLSRPDMITDGKGAIKKLSYDALDRVTIEQIRPSASASPDQTIYYCYDQNGNLARRYDRYTPPSKDYATECGANPPDAHTQYTYDGLNREVSETRPDGSMATYSYDNRGNLAMMTPGQDYIYGYAFPQATMYTYDENSNLKTVSDPLKNQYSFSYNSADQLQSVNYPNGMTKTLTYPNEQLTEIRYTKPGGAVAQDFKYSYTKGTRVSDLLQQFTDQDANSTAYGYDSLNRLTSAALTAGNGHSYQYSYDDVGDRLSSTVDGAKTTATYNDASEQVDSGYGYDARGNQLARPGGHQAGYSDSDQMTGSYVPSGPNGALGGYVDSGYTGDSQSDRFRRNSVQYYNTLLGTSVALNQSSQATYYSLLHQEDIYGQNTCHKYNYYTRDPDGNLLGLLINSDAAGCPSTTTNYIYTTDHNGSVYGLYGPDANAAVTYSYDPYGNSTKADPAPGTTIQNPYRFDGEALDAGGLYYISDRYYDPAAGRWTQPDPIPHVDDPSQSAGYAYSGNDPINGSDPTGCELQFVPAGPPYAVEKVYSFKHFICIRTKHYQPTDIYQIYHFPDGEVSRTLVERRDFRVGRATTHCYNINRQIKRHFPSGPPKA